jgi:superfamily II DNA or RNA helicase
VLTLAQDVINTIIERGELSKSDIQKLWGVSDEQYVELQRELADQKLLVPGPKGKGGFEARYAKRAKAADESAPGPTFEHEWQNRGLERLVELFSHNDLENLLGDLVYTVRRSRQQMTGEDRRGSKRELAAALIIQHGVDLFRDLNVRTLVGKRCEVKPPGRWHPGKSGALEFVAEAQFPAEFAGIPTQETPPDFEYLEGRFDLQPLQDFQKEVQAEMQKVIARPGGRAIVTLPTGAGKTRVAVDTIRDWLTQWHANRTERTGRVVVWLAHTEELCEQAFTCFKQVWEASNGVCPLLLFRFWGQYTQDLVDHRENLASMHQRATVLVSTPQRLVNLVKSAVPRADEVLADIVSLTSLIVIDEAHRAAAPMYQTILTRFREAESNTAVVGLTATPFRAEYSQDDPTAGTTELKRLFQRIIEPTKTLGDDPRSELQARGYLASPTWDSIKTKTLLRPPPIQNLLELTDYDIERIDYALKVRADNASRRLVVLEHLRPIAAQPDAKILYFGPTVLDAECMAFLLRQEGISSAFVSGKTRDVTRRRVVEEFKNGSIKVLCNCEVLTTGFDAPKVTHVVMARPTVSQVLYEQMVGRGLRGPKFGGTQSCVIIDCEDNYRSDRPVLGYRRFREVWKPKGRR